MLNINKCKTVVLCFIFAFILLGIGCISYTQKRENTPLPQEEVQKEYSDYNTTKTEKGNTACIQENRQATGQCCEGLEPIAVDHAFTVCKPIGTKVWSAGTCTKAGDAPYVDAPCCEGLDTFTVNNKVICMAK